jgi:hypothetical protein
MAGKQEAASYRQVAVVASRRTGTDHHGSQPHRHRPRRANRRQSRYGCLIAAHQYQICHDLIGRSIEENEANSKSKGIRKS